MVHKLEFEFAPARNPNCWLNSRLRKTKIMSYCGTFVRLTNNEIATMVFRNELLVHTMSTNHAASRLLLATYNIQKAGLSCRKLQHKQHSHTHVLLLVYQRDHILLINQWETSMQIGFYDKNKAITIPTSTTMQVLHLSIWPPEIEENTQPPLSVQ